MKPWWKEWVDQPLHMLMATGLFCMAYFQIPLAFSALFAFFWMWLRELEQHKWDWRAVGRTDLSFVLAACVLCLIFFSFYPFKT